MKRVLLILVVSLAMTACDSASNTEPDDVELDRQLEALITLDGQRRLENFLLPDSEDFAKIPQDIRNPLSQDKVLLGKLLFHDPALGSRALRPEGRGTYSCATCHHAKAGFAAGRQQSIGDGGSGWGSRGEARTGAASYTIDQVDAPPLRSPTVLNSAYQRVMLWSGAAGAHGPNKSTGPFWSSSPDARMNHLGYDGVETQAILALDNHRMGGTTEALIQAHPTYRDLWNRVFPDQPVSDELAGLAIAAFERTVLANRSPYQRWLRGETRAMTSKQKRGALVFFGESKCADCHTGPALNSMAFYALGMPDMRGQGVIRPPAQSMGRGTFIEGPETDFTFKVPQLYNMTDSPFLGHGGTFRSVAEVVDYYVIGKPEVLLPPGTVTDQFHALTLTKQEVSDLIEFLSGGLRDPELMRYQPASVPSGGCIPANDVQARRDLGCN